MTDFVVEPRRQVIDVLEQPPRVLDDSLAVDNRFRGHPGMAVLPMWSIRVVYSSTIGAMRSRPARKRLLRSGSWSAIAIGVSSIEYRTGNIGKNFLGVSIGTMWPGHRSDSLGLEHWNCYDRDRYPERTLFVDAVSGRVF